jgi:two-component system, cell cycle response regulator
MPTNLQQYLNDQYQEVKVLFVEEEKFTREKLLRVLKRRFANVNVTAAIDELEGFQLYQSYQPDLIICDLNINQPSGIEMIKKIRTLNEQVQVITITTYDEHNLFIQSMKNIVNHFILKPIDLEQLLQAIQKSVYQLQLEKELANQKKLTRAILDFQENLILIIENDEIIEFNQAFCNFTGISKRVTHLNKNKGLSSYFVEDAKYFSPKDKSRWFEEIAASGNKGVKAHMIDSKGKDVIYCLKAEAIQGTNQFLLIGNDITESENESSRYKHLVLMDSLTNSISRVKFDDILEKEFKRADRLRQPISVILMDIDFFTNVNEHFGQQAGDQVLTTISTIVQQRIRESDIFARWGGEVFILLTPNTDRNGALELAESIRSIIADFDFNHIGKVTCSFGITEFSRGKANSDVVLEADQALTQSKNNGRNCVTLYNLER